MSIAKRYGPFRSVEQQTALLLLPLSRRLCFDQCPNISASDGKKLRRARIVSAIAIAIAIARGRLWLDEMASGSVSYVLQIASRQKCSARQVNMTISLAFLEAVGCG